MPSKDRIAPATTGKWLSVVGIGEDGIDGLGAEAKSRIAEAKTVFGSVRHLSLAKPLIRGQASPWPSPFDATMSAVKTLRGSRVCVLASGDPFMHGVGGTLARGIDPHEMHVIPHVSSLSLAAARLGWSLQDIDTISLHGRDIPTIRPLLHSGNRILALTSDETGPGRIAEMLKEAGFGPSGFFVLEALGGPDEKITATSADRFDLPAVHPINLVAIVVKAENPDVEIPLSQGLADVMFEHDGQITRREIRAITILALAPRRGELLWDIGAGAGSISIEWLLRHPSMRAIAIEKNPDRAGRITVNASKLGVPTVDVLEGRAPQAFAGLPQPDAIFVGGGGSEPDVMKNAIAHLRSGGRIVANGVTLELEAVLLKLHNDLGGDLTRLSIAKATDVGSMRGWRPAMPIIQWSWRKP